MRHRWTGNNRPEQLREGEIEGVRLTFLLVSCFRKKIEKVCLTPYFDILTRYSILSQKTRQRRSQLLPNCRSIANKAPHSAPLRHFTIRIAATSVRLRGLVQHVPSTRLRTGLSLPSLLPARIIPELDYFYALGIKRYTLGLCVRTSHFDPRRYLIDIVWVISA